MDAFFVLPMLILVGLLAFCVYQFMQES
jgi:hypothetical protein